MNKEAIVCYMHAGSGNHGCEAIANSTCQMLEKPIRLISNRPEEDRTYSVGKLCEIVPYRKVTTNILHHGLLFLKRFFPGQKDSYARYQYQEVLGPNAYQTCLSIGGDNYCYEDMLFEVMSVNRELRKQGSDTVLWGCSIEPDVLKRSEVLSDLLGYRLIIARESITYDALCAAGLGKTTVLCPDPAFTLKTDRKAFPEGFINHGVVGINLSPLIMKSESVEGITIDNYRELIRYLLSETSLNIALIPHVIWENNDDRIPMKLLLSEISKEYKECNRIHLVEDCNCMELKGYIAACKYFIGARTHATIAAYSSCVPTLVVGYSVKARGIAKDIFGTDKNYVLPVQSLSDRGDLVKAFSWIVLEELAIREHLEKVMPEYIQRAGLAKEYLTERC